MAAPTDQRLWAAIAETGNRREVSRPPEHVADAQNLIPNCRLAENEARNSFIGFTCADELHVESLACSDVASLAIDPKWKVALAAAGLTCKQSVIVCISCRFDTPACDENIRH